MKETFAKPHVTENEEQNENSRYVKEIQTCKRCVIGEEHLGFPAPRNLPS